MPSLVEAAEYLDDFVCDGDERCLSATRTYLCPNELCADLFLTCGQIFAIGLDIDRSGAGRRRPRETGREVLRGRGLCTVPCKNGLPPC